MDVFVDGADVVHAMRVPTPRSDRWRQTVCGIKVPTSVIDDVDVTKINCIECTARWILSAGDGW